MNAVDRDLWKLAVPAFAALIAEPAMILIDTAIVGRLGTAELAALAAGSTVLMTIVGLCIFLAYGTTATVARRHGSGDTVGAVAEGISGLWLAALIGTVLAGATALGAPWLAEALSSSPAVADLATEYLRVGSLSIPAVLIVFASTGALRGVLDLRSPLIAMIAATTVNAPLTWWLVHELQWSMTGAALGLVLAQWGAAVWLVSRLLRRAGPTTAWRPHVGGILHAARAGTPLIVRTATLRAALLLATFIAASQGDDVLAGHQIVSAVVTFLAFALDALAIAAQTLIGNSLGAGDINRTRGITARTMRWGLVTGLLLAVGMVVSSPWLVTAFSGDSSVATVTVPALIVAAFIQPVSGVVFALDGILIGAGDAAYLAKAGVIVLMAYAPVAALVGLFDGGLVWLWGAYGIFQGARLATLWHRERTDTWLILGASNR